MRPPACCVWQCNKFRKSGKIHCSSFHSFPSITLKEGVWSMCVCVCVWPLNNGQASINLSLPHFPMQLHMVIANGLENPCYRLDLYDWWTEPNASIQRFKGLLQKMDWAWGKGHTRIMRVTEIIFRHSGPRFVWQDPLY